MNEKIDVSRRQFLTAALGASATAVLAPLMGCGGGNGGSHNSFLNGNSGLFVSANQTVGDGVGHTHIQLKNGIPIRQGMEFTPAALNGLPTEPPSTLVVPFIGPMPAQTHGSPFTNVFLAYLTSHPATNEPPHFHLAILIRPATVTAEPFTHERTAVVADELPPDYVRTVNALQPGGIVVAGGGVIYDDPTEPAGLVPATTLGQNYLYYDGHMNGMVLGPTIAQMKSKETLVFPIKQPKLYPREGYYPRNWAIRFDAARGTHLIEMMDFVLAKTNVVPAGT